MLLSVIYTSVISPILLHTSSWIPLLLSIFFYIWLCIINKILLFFTFIEIYIVFNYILSLFSVWALHALGFVPWKMSVLQTFPESRKSNDCRHVHLDLLCYMQGNKCNKCKNIMQALWAGTGEKSHTLHTDSTPLTAPLLLGPYSEDSIQIIFRKKNTYSHKPRSHGR